MALFALKEPSIKFVAIVVARDETESIVNTLTQLGRAGVNEVVLICNGCTDNTLSRALGTANSHVYPLRILWFKKALGHDVGRAVGTYVALRRHHLDKASWGVVFVDADWAGSYGPMLGDFLDFARSSPTDVVSLTWQSLRQGASVDDDYPAWLALLSRQKVVPPSSVPFVLPITIRLQAFDRLTPIWLANPGWWLASAIDANLQWGVYEKWDMALVGHRSRSRIHYQAMMQRIARDGELAKRWCNQWDGRSDADDGGWIEPKSAILPARDFNALCRFGSAMTITMGECLEKGGINGDLQDILE